MSAKNGTLTIENTTMDYICFGSGSRNLIILPGLGDGLRTVKGTALAMAAMYRMFARDFTVYALSRRNCLPEGFSTRDMARDVILAMDALGIEKADFFAVSMGGMIAQYAAIDYPNRVGKLVLAVTSSQPNPILKQSIALWMDQARRSDHIALMDSNLQLIYSEAYYRKNKRLIPVIAKMTKPESYDRFLIQAQACLDHNAYGQLSSITAPTLVIGAKQDKALGCEASRELAAAIPSAKLHIYPKWGHGVYEEEKDFNPRVLNFLL